MMGKRSPRFASVAVLVLGCGGLKGPVVHDAPTAKAVATALPRGPERVATALPGPRLVMASDVACVVAAASTKSPSTVSCWGDVGAVYPEERTPMSSSVAVTIPGLDGVESLALSSSAKLCVVKTDGVVSCSGLGGGYAYGGVPGLPAAHMVVVLRRGLCVLARDETVSCAWFDRPNSIERVQGVTGAVALRSDAESACAILSDGRIACWAIPEAPEPLRAVPLGTEDPQGPRILRGGKPLTGVVDMTLSNEGACAALANGTITCWSEFAERRLEIPEVAGATRVSVGDRRGCAVLGDGEVACFDALQGGGAPQHPSRRAELSKVREIALTLDDRNGCALTEESGVWCWGSANLLGDGVPRQNVQPARVALSGATSVSTVGARTCATTRTGDVYCWGNFDRSNRTAPAPARVSGGPVRVRGLQTAGIVDCGGPAETCCFAGGSSLGAPTDLCLSDMHLDGSGAGRAWTASVTPYAASWPAEACDEPVHSLWARTVGNRTCVVQDDGIIRCETRTENDDEEQVPRRFRVKGTVRALAFDSEGEFLCALSDGSAYCSSLRPDARKAAPETDADEAAFCAGEPLERLPVARGATQLAAMADDSELAACALEESGRVLCWQNRNTEYGPARRTPTVVRHIPRARWVGAGLVLDRDGGLWAVDALFEARAVSGFPRLISVSKWDATCGLTAGGDAYCAGSNELGQAGHGIEPYRDAAAPVRGLP